MALSPPIATAVIADPANFYAGRAVNVLSREAWGDCEVCKVELVDHPGLTTSTRFEHLSDYAETALPYAREGNDLICVESNGFRHRVYSIARVGRGWGREAFMSGGYWTGDGWWPSYIEASAELDALCDRLNGKGGEPTPAEAEDDGQPDEAQEWADFDPDC